MKKYLALAATTLTLSACAPSSNEAANDANPATAKASENAATAGSLIERINHHGTVTVGTEGTYAPFTYHDQSGKLTGYDVEVTRAVADKLGFKVEFLETPWDSMLAGLKSGRFDMVANQVALSTPERRATFDKSEPYSYSGAMAVNREGDKQFKDLKEIKDLKSAQSLSSNYGEMAVEAGASIVPVDGMAQALTLVQQKRVDLTLNDSLALLDFLKKNPESHLQVAWRASDKIGSGLILNKGNDEALQKINGAIKELQQEGKLKALGEQFFGEDISEPN